jgi:hypothetical protein
LVGFALPVEDHARFQALCRARCTTMRAEIQAILRAQLAHRSCLLSEMQCVRVSPELKRQLSDYARERRMSLAKLAQQAFGTGAGPAIGQLGQKVIYGKRR